MARQIAYRGFMLTVEADRLDAFMWAATVYLSAAGFPDSRGKYYEAPGLYRSEAEAEEAALEIGRAAVRAGDVAREQGP
jgi:hypothetical protein